MWKKTTSLFTKKKGSSSSKPSSTTSSRRHSVSESPQSMEEDTAPPRRNDALLLGGMRATRSTSMRFTKPQGFTVRSTSAVDLFIRAASIHSAVFHIWLHYIVGGGGEEALSS
jgi:hypothetical protein